MTKSLDKITNHYHRALTGDLKKLHVPEWEMDIYYKNTYTFEDEAKVIELQSQGKIVDALITSLIVKARDENGKKIFSEADKLTLMKEADPNVITRICGVINNASLKPSYDTLAKE